jgi:ATPase subunit of ABC transporter with duplicated ATPase domains
MHRILTATGVSFEFPNGRLVFSNLSAAIDSKLTALVGPNGIGKTCLAKLFAGEFEPTLGQIVRSSPLHLFQQREIPLKVSVENYLSTHFLKNDLSENLLHSIDPTRLCSQLSGGEWMRVRLAKASKENFLILDEPTNDLDLEGRKILFEFLQQRPGGALLISHDRECLQLCDEILELSQQGLTKYGMTWEKYEVVKARERKNLRNELEEAKNLRAQLARQRTNQIGQQEKRNRKGKQIAAKGGMPKILIGNRKRQAQVTTGKIDAATFDRAHTAVQNAFQAYTALKVDSVMYANIFGNPLPEQKLIAEASSFNIYFSDWLFAQDLNFSWRGNLRVGIKGSNGSGKSTLVKALTGTQFMSRGELRKGRLNTLYLDQTCSNLDDGKSILENIHDVAHSTEGEIRNALAHFLFTKERVFQKVSTLSGGERLRVALAKGLLASTKPELLILDEPTNNLDLVNLQFLEQLIRQFPAALILISHDEMFMKNCDLRNELQLPRRLQMSPTDDSQNETPLNSEIPLEIQARHKSGRNDL